LFNFLCFQTNAIFLLYIIRRSKRILLYIANSGLGFRNVQAEMDMTERLWDEKEKLLYGETPLFGVMADK